MTNENEPKHTPGMWRIGDAGRTIFGPKTDSPCPEVIATLGKNFRANAALIAAAPEMLEALKLAVEMLDSVGLSDGGNPDIDNMRAAIAKAEGKEE